MNAVEVKPSRTRGFDLRREGAGGAGWAGAGRTPSSRSDAYPGGFTGALFPDVLASAKSSRHFASMAPVSRYAIWPMKIGEAPRTAPRSGSPRCPEPTLRDRGRSLGLAAASSRTLRRGERAALARSCPLRAEVCGAPRPDEIVTEPPRPRALAGRANVFQPAGRRRRAALSLAHGSMGRKRDESGRGAFVSFVQSSYV